jgi:adenosylmethionine-8-amino-7-oxononanoate aminotransferase
MDGHFHGATLGAMGVTAWPARRAPWDAVLGPLILGLPEEEPGETSAAFIAETIPVAASLVRMPQPGDLAEIRSRCDAADALWIADEILTGFGRVGSLFAWKRWAEENAADAGAVPDLIAFGKGAGAGFAPLGGVLVAERVAELVAGKALQVAPLHQQTYGGNPISCAVGRAVLRALRADGGFQRAREMEARLRDVVSATVGGAGAAVDAFGALAGFQTASGGFVRDAAKNGLLAGGDDGSEASRAFLAPPLAMTEEDWGELRQMLEATAREGAAG